MSLELIGGLWCPAGDPYFKPKLESGQFWDQWTLDQALPHVKQWRLCLDIGAHIGTWTVPLAHRFEAVVAFEPDPQNFLALTRNLALAEASNVKALPIAIAHRSGRYALSHEGTINSGEGFLRPLTNGEDWVPALRLDDAKFEHVDLIKIDVEGLEWEVFANGEETIRSCKPVIVLEESHLGARYGGEVGDTRRLLEGWGMAVVAQREFIPNGYDVVMAWPD